MFQFISAQLYIGIWVNFLAIEDDTSYDKLGPTFKNCSFTPCWEIKGTLWLSRRPWALTSKSNTGYSWGHRTLFQYGVALAPAKALLSTSLVEELKRSGLAKFPKIVSLRILAFDFFQLPEDLLSTENPRFWIFPVTQMSSKLGESLENFPS